MTDTIQVDMSDLGDRVVSYSCSLVMNQNTLEDLIVPFYYENVYPCSENEALGRDFVADALLTRAKDSFLEDATICTSPQNPWFGRVSSLPEDEIYTPLACSASKTNEYNAQMLDLMAQGADPMQEVPECCVVVHGSMTFTKLASMEDENVMLEWVAGQLNDTSLALPYRTHYLGAVREEPSVEGNLPPAINVNDGNITNNTTGSNFTDLTSSNGNSNNNGNAPLPDSSLTDIKPTASAPRQGDNDPGLTWVGVLIAAALVLAFCAVLYLIFRRRRHYVKGLDVEGVVVDSSEHSSSHKGGGGNSSRHLKKDPKPGTRAAAGGGAAGATMSVEEDYDDFQVTIVPTHTNSTQSGSIKHEQHHHHRSADDDDEDGGFVEMLHDDDYLDVESNDAPLQVSVLSDNPNMKIRSVAVNSFHTTANQEDDEDLFVGSGGANNHLFNGLDHHKTGGNGGATQSTGSTSSGTYQFDLADANRNAIMGTYMGGFFGAAAAAAATGPITMTVVPPYPMEETSDSDIDSWAQTEGTVGSLEDRYEETGEI